MADWDEDYINAKYHLSVSKRLYGSYFDFEEKRFLVGLINEMAKSVSCIIGAFLIFEGVRRGSGEKKLDVFLKKICPKYFDSKTIENLSKILEVRRAQKDSPVEFSRGENIILLINGKYRFLNVERFKEFLDSLEKAILEFGKVSRQV